MIEITKETLFSSNTQAENEQLSILKRHFPNCFDKQGAFLPEKMAKALQSNGIKTEKESYSLNWLGKSYAKILKDRQPETLLAEDIEHNQKPENQNSENILIQGDNLEVLKHLKHAYKNQIKMIYIDPPYNTGSDGFVYQDDRKFTPQQLVDLGMDLEEAKRVLEFTAKKSNSHSAWLTFMYPRLYIARELLRDDGVIFISIDDNEQAQLKLLCDEVFGEENFVDILIVKKSANGMGSKEGYSTNHDFILVYSKKKQDKNFIGITVSEDYIESFKKIDEFGKYKTDGLFRKKGRSARREDSPNCFYPIYADLKTGKVYLTQNEKNDLKEIFPKLPNGNDGRWIWSMDFAEDKTHRLYSSPQGTIYVKDYWSDDLREKPRSILEDNAYLTDTATNEIIDLFGLKVFSTPKPQFLITDLVDNCTKNEDIILDFFAGSATTAHAIEQLCATDKQKRKFIVVQIPDDLDEAYKVASKDGKEIIQNAINWLDKHNKPHNLFEITKARIELASKKIQTENPDYTGDLGFKIFKTEPHFQTTLNTDFDSQIDFLPKTDLNNEQLHTLLTTWRVFDGCRLPEKVETVDLAGYQAFYCCGHLYLLASGFTSENVKALIERLDNDKDFVPERIVLFGENIDSVMQKELAQAVKTYANKKGLNNLSVLARY
ncbi:site-specific DNA-methyltransferase [Haemophilus haemolyticus]|uniref:site-specific DNA-methyltransferase n=1 Tax=Haemophilus haemolyticus TaxID=726 RepID=UPI000E584291|nr:site-specific DNA-methyltransferase [Haemophilus haemolyticus]